MITQTATAPKKKLLTTQAITKIALFVAVLSVSAYISIPIGAIPLTLQTLIINMAAIILSPFEGFVMTLVYILLGLVGVPVFSGGAGGPAKLFGPTGGYIFAFLAAVPLMSFLKGYFLKLIGKFTKNKGAAEFIAYTLTAILIGMVVIYLIGTVYMKLTMGKTWGQTLMAAVVPFIPLDLCKCAAASIIGIPVKRALDKIKK